MASAVPSRPEPMMATLSFRFLLAGMLRFCLLSVVIPGIFTVQAKSIRAGDRLLQAVELMFGRTTKAPNLCIIDCASGISENKVYPSLRSIESLEVFEMNNFSRATSAFVLTASLLVSSVAAVAQTSTSKPAEQLQRLPKARSQTAEDKKTDDKKTAKATTDSRQIKQTTLDQRRPGHDRQAQYQRRDLIRR